MNNPKPDYDKHGAKLYLGDAREILPTLPDGIADVVITDPPWAIKGPDIIPGQRHPKKLLTQVAQHFPRLTDRAIIHLGTVSDPRMLTAIPKEMPFIRVCVLRFCPPYYRGKLLIASDFAYVYGTIPKKHSTTVPGECIKTRPECKNIGHPCPRRIYHLEWLVKWFAEGLVLDPFMGSGTTGFAAVKAGYPFIGIEIHEEYFNIAVERIEAAAKNVTLTEHRNGQGGLFE